MERDSKKPQHRKKARKHESPLFLERKIVKKEMYATYPLNRQCFSLCSARISEVVFHSWWVAFAKLATVLLLKCKLIVFVLCALCSKKQRPEANNNIAPSFRAEMSFGTPLRNKILEATHFPLHSAFWNNTSHQEKRIEIQLKKKKGTNVSGNTVPEIGVSRIAWIMHVHKHYAPQAHAQASSLIFVAPAAISRTRTSFLFWLLEEMFPTCAISDFFSF